MKFSGAAIMVIWIGGYLVGAEQTNLTQGVVIQLKSGKATLTRLDALPYVENGYTKRFKFDSASNPKLKELRERYKLDEVVSSGHDEFDQQVLLMDWAHHRFKKFGTPSTNATSALDILA